MEKKESVAGHREAKTEKRKSIENAQKQHLGGEERRNSKQVKKKVSSPTVLLFSAVFPNKAFKVWQEFTVH